MELPFELNKAKKLTDDDISRIIELYKFGENVSSIARLYGVRRMSVYHHIYKILYPSKFHEMEQRKIERNKKYDLRGNTKDHKKRLMKAHGRKEVAKYLQEIKDKWVEKNKEKFIEQRRKYRDKNREHINENWRKNYHKRKLRVGSGN